MCFSRSPIGATILLASHPQPHAARAPTSSLGNVKCKHIVTALVLIWREQNPEVRGAGAPMRKSIFTPDRPPRISILASPSATRALWRTRLWPARSC